MRAKSTKILLIETNDGIAASLQAAFGKQRIHCDIDPAEDVEAFTRDDVQRFDSYNAVLVGTLEARDRLAELVRGAGSATPILGLLDHRCSEESIRLLNGGFDDILVKPVNPNEVLARINAITRRGHGHSGSNLQIGRITVYLDGRDPEVDGERIKLSHREHTIFSELALRTGKVVSKETIYNAVYGMLDSQPFDKVVDVYICKLRKKLAKYTDGAEYIETVYGRGYKLEAPEAHQAGDLRPAAEVTELHRRLAG